MSDVIRAVQRNKVLTFFNFILLSVAVFGFALWLPAKYEASATLMVGSPTGASNTMTAGRADATVSLAKIAESSEVVRNAILKIGVDWLQAPANSTRIGEWISTNLRNDQKPGSPVERSLPIIAKSLSVKVEPNSNIIRIAFSNKDPKIAAAFVNAIVEELVSRVAAISSNFNEARFYEKQVEDLSSSMRQAAEKLAAFEIANSAYSIEQQKQLLVKRSHELNAALFATRGQIAAKSGERTALAAQLRDLRPVTSSKYVSALVARLGNSTPKATDQTDIERLAATSPEPPIVMVRILQDTMAQLFKVDAELKGLHDLEQEQTSQLARLDTDLNRLTKNEITYEELKKALSTASASFDAYSKRAIDEATSARFNEAKFTDVKIVQAAFPPLHSTLPGNKVLAATALAGGLVGSIIIVLLIELLAGHAPKRSKNAAAAISCS